VRLDIGFLPLKPGFDRRGVEFVVNKMTLAQRFGFPLPVIIPTNMRYHSITTHEVYDSPLVFS
jgi:hypothetical protein